MSDAQDPWTSLSATSLSAMMRARKISPSEVVDGVLARIERLNPALRAFLTVTESLARQQATAAEHRILTEDVSSLPPLLGVPFAAKDVIATRGVRTTFGSPLFANNVPDENAVAIDRLQNAGAILVGKTNTPEFGLLGETRNLLGNECTNPWNVTRTSGGSSGGAAAAVAARLGPFGLGTDGAGSVVAPAAMCGVFGVKATRGLIPHTGGRSETGLYTDTGLLVTNTDDARLLLRTIRGSHRRDPLSRQPSQRQDSHERSPLRVAVSVDLGHFSADDEAQQVVWDAAATLEGHSARVVPATPDIPNPWEIYDPVFFADAWSSLGEQAEAYPDMFLPDARSEVECGRNITQVQVVRSLRRWWEFGWQVQEFFDRFDALLLPTTATSAFPLGQPPRRIGDRDVRPHWTTFMPFPVAWNLAGNPEVNVPFGFSTDGLPLGVLVVAGHGREDVALHIADLLIGDHSIAAPTDSGLQPNPAAREEAQWC